MSPKPRLWKRFAATALLAGLCLALGLKGRVHADDIYEMDDNIIRHFHLGEMYYERHEMYPAIREWQIAIRLKPTAIMSASVYNDLGKAYQQIGLVPQAIVSYQQAIALNPNFDLYYKNLAGAYRATGQDVAAMGQLRTATDANPQDAQAWYLLGELYRERGETARSTDAFQRYIRLMPASVLSIAAKRYVETASDGQTGSP